jgi:8-oxo-dGTP pyrophosphatase MutT (NUDIX family)
VTLPTTWTGRSACALQAALRLTNDAYARQLGLAVRTVANWHENPDVTPRNSVQKLLDGALRDAPASARAQFAALTASPAADPPDEPDPARRMRVAVGIVVRGDQVLLVQPRDDADADPRWQFPAGMIKPGARPETAVVRETYAETGVHCRAVRDLGSRLHPITRVYCDYLLCEYLTGEAANLDPAENASVTWAPIDTLTRFIPREHIFPPVLDALEIPDDPTR